jgi:Uncharacterized conserved protein
MKTLVVSIKVSKEKIGDFIEATRENMAHSRREPGVLRFDLLQDEADPSRFLLVEAYRDAEAQAAHKESAHYAKWRQLAEPMMAEPRTRAVYRDFEPASL